MVALYPDEQHVDRTKSYPHYTSMLNFDDRVFDDSKEHREIQTSEQRVDLQHRGTEDSLDVTTRRRSTSTGTCKVLEMTTWVISRDQKSISVRELATEKIEKPEIFLL